MKICKTCLTEKVLSDFRSSRDECKKCENKKRVERKKRLLLNPEYKEKYMEYDAKRKRKKRASGDVMFNAREKISNAVRKGITRGYEKNTSTYEILGETYEFVIEYIQRKFVDGMTWDNHGEWEIDHIIPVSIAKDYDEVVKLNHYSNLQPLWKEVNRKKSNKII